MISRFLITLGLVLIVAGVLVGAFAKIPFLGRLPGDLVIEKKNFTLYLPLGTSLLISLLLSLIFWILARR